MLIQTLKGFRDFLPHDARKRQYVIDSIKCTFESFGFEPLETPALEYGEILLGRYGDEGEKLMYKFKDHGDRNVAMRYDQTVPLARVVAQYGNDIPLPFKRFQIQPVWRAENTQKGRFREFLQCDIDTIGTGSLLADAEIITVLAKALEDLGVKNFKILINSRTVFEDLNIEAVSSIDKLKKIGEDGVIKELVNKKVAADNNEAKSILDKVRNSEKPESIGTITTLTKDLGLDEKRIEFSPTLARGLSYYTSTIFEIEIEGNDSGSVAGGGRYDGLIGIFTNKDIPAVGGSFGFDRLIDAMETLELFPDDLISSKILVTVPTLDLAEKAVSTATKLRNSGINTEIYLDIEVPLEKQLKYADKKSIPYVILFENERIVLKDMKSGDKTVGSIEEIMKKVCSDYDNHPCDNCPQDSCNC